MKVVTFRKPELDDEMATALEQIGESQKLLRYFIEQRAAIRAVRDALGRSVKSRIIEMLDDDLESLDHDVETAEAQVGDWKEILEILQSRSS